MLFLFPESMILFFRHKRKDDPSQKFTWKCIFFMCSEKIISPKNTHLDMIFYVISGKMVFLLSRNYEILSPWKKMIFIKKHMEIQFSVYMHKCHIYDNALMAKKAKIPLSRKNASKGNISGTTEKIDIHPRKYGISAEISYWLTPEKKLQKQPPEVF